jgi:hypothetical protein
VIALLNNVYYGGEILNTPSGVDYIIDAACTIFIPNKISFGDLRKFISISICSLARTNLLSKHELTHHNQIQMFIIIFYCVSLKDIWGVVKIFMTPVMEFRTMNLIVELSHRYH